MKIFVDLVRLCGPFIWRNKWLVGAVVSEVLGLLAAFGSIPGLPLPTAWMLAIAGILSGAGVVIVTVYFMIQYNRRPLNDFQKREIAGSYLSQKEAMDKLSTKEEIANVYLSKSDARETLAPKSVLEDFDLFWHWRYQKSVIDFAWSMDALRNKPGFIIVAERESVGCIYTRNARLCCSAPRRLRPLFGNGGGKPSEVIQ